MPGIVVGDCNTNGLYYAYNSILAATSQNELQKMIYAVVIEREKIGPQLEK